MVDLKATGFDERLKWLKLDIEDNLKLKTQILGIAKWQKREIKTMNRIIRCTEKGLEYKAD